MTSKTAAFEAGAIEAMEKEALFKKWRARRQVKAMGGPEAVKKMSTKLYHKAMNFSNAKVMSQSRKLDGLLRAAAS